MWDPAVRWGVSAFCWVTMPKRRSLVGRYVMSRSAHHTRPWSGSMRPAAIRSAVLLPHPDGPISARQPPESISTLRPRSAGVASKSWET